MRMMLRVRLLLLVVATSAPLGVLVGQSDERPTMSDIRAWIAAHHPDLYAGDTTTNLLYIVVDTNKNYVRSATAHADSAEAALAGAAMRRFMELNEDSLMAACVGDSTASAKPVARPLCIVDGARVRGFSTLQLLSARGIEVLRGTEARTKYGGDGANGAVVFTTIPARAARFTQLGLDGDSVDNMMHLGLRGGVIGPTPLNIFVLFLAAGRR